MSARAELTKPTLICCKTTIGFGSPNKAGTSGVHGSPLGEDEVEVTRKELGWSHKPFEIPEKIRAEWNHCEAGDASNSQWNDVMALYSDDYPIEHALLQRLIANEIPEDFTQSFEAFLEELQAGENKDVATRKASEVCLNFFCEQLPELVGGSADLTGSNNTFSSASEIL